MFKLDSHTFARNQSGIAALEFALILPAFAAMLLGSIEFGLIFYTYNASGDTARYITRQIAFNKLLVADAEATAKSKVPPWISDTTKVSVTQSAPTDPTKNLIVVDLYFPMAKAAPTSFFAWAYGSREIHSKVTMQQEENK